MNLTELGVNIDENRTQTPKHVHLRQKEKHLRPEKKTPDSNETLATRKEKHLRPEKQNA